MTTRTAPLRRLLIATIAAGTLLGTPAHAEMLNCVQYIKQTSSVALHGNAYQWWDAAAGLYGRGNVPVTGAVMVFSKTRHLPFGHVALVEKRLDDRTVLIDHANWSLIGGRRGHVERSVRVVDVSPNNDWSQVRVWYAGLSNVGDTVYRVRGFVYPNSAAAAHKPVRYHSR